MERLRLAELCASTSLFTDLGTGQPVEHGLRTCLVAMRLATAMDSSDDTLRDVFYVSLLRFLGCTADLHEITGIAGGDEPRFMADMAPVTMGSSAEEMGGLLRMVGAGPSRLRRARHLLTGLTDPGSKNRFLGAHCEVASRLAQDMGLPAGVTAGLEVAYARWDGRGVPTDVGGEDIPLSTRIAIVARDIEQWARASDASGARKVLTARRGKAYDPGVVDVAMELGPEELRRCDGDLWDVVLALEPTPRVMVAGPEADRVLRALGDFADLKSPERAGHSRRVERLVTGAIGGGGPAGEGAQALRHAAMVHDVGMVAVPSNGLDAHAASSPALAEQMRLHPVWGERLLRRCTGLAAAAAIVGRHHERMDGSGYPMGVDGDVARAGGLLACAELYDERMMERGASGHDGRERAQEIAAELIGMCDAGLLHRDDVRALIEATGQHAPLIDVRRPAGLTDREVEVLRLLALGRTNRAIAGELGISVRTVGAHVEHIYDKADVRSRAAATLFASQHDLLG